MMQNGIYIEISESKANRYKTLCPGENFQKRQVKTCERFSIRDTFVAGINKEEIIGIFRFIFATQNYSIPMRTPVNGAVKFQDRHHTFRSDLSPIKIKNGSQITKFKTYIKFFKTQFPPFGKQEKRISSKGFFKNQVVVSSKYDQRLFRRNKFLEKVKKKFKSLFGRKIAHFFYHERFKFKKQIFCNLDNRRNGLSTNFIRIFVMQLLEISYQEGIPKRREFLQNIKNEFYIKLFNRNPSKIFKRIIKRDKIIRRREIGEEPPCYWKTKGCGSSSSKEKYIHSQIINQFGGM